MKTPPFNLSDQERQLFGRLSTPGKIQDFLDTLPINCEPEGDTCRSPREMLRHGTAHCIEGALLAAAALWHHGSRPLLLDLKSAAHDYDHVVALFKERGKWGAISKTNHAILRYRDPVYATVRELALSYFHEYIDDTGKKTLRSFSKPFSLTRYGGGWVTAAEDLWEIGGDLDESPHYPIVSPAEARKLRRASAIEISGVQRTEYEC